ncbi:unnamed protein product [Phytophthora lilii]|uniref:Unnamed protein product n=1 Tax=Phytophthora lilii TaxID=2077276 RepID=A0A9W6TKU2_9STRA|nr:unnamed protein product [Phytophthora lilii]
MPGKDEEWSEAGLCTIAPEGCGSRSSEFLGLMIWHGSGGGLSNLHMWVEVFEDHLSAELKEELDCLVKNHPRMKFSARQKFTNSASVLVFVGIVRLIFDAIFEVAAPQEIPLARYETSLVAFIPQSFFVFRFSGALTGEQFEHASAITPVKVTDSIQTSRGSKMILAPLLAPGISGGGVVCTKAGAPISYVGEPVVPSEDTEQRRIMTDSEDEREQAASLRAFEASSDAIIAKTALQYVDFVRCRRRVVDARKWLKLKSERGVDLYTERVELRAAPSVCNSRRSLPSDCGAADSFGALRTTMVSAFGGGTRPGTLDEVMDGLYADSTEQMQLNASIQYGSMLDCGVVRTFRARSDAKPHEFFGVKFVEKFGHIPGVIDQLCWVERMDTMVMGGRRFGFQLIKSVETEDRTSDQSVRRVNMSVCYLYCQAAPDAVDVFIRGIVELPGSTKPKRRQETINAAGDYILATIHGRECQRMKTIAALIERSKTERESLKYVICRLGWTLASRLCLLTVVHVSHAVLSESLRGTKLQSRYGSTRGDGDLPDTVAKSYRESESFRMMLPIRDPRPSSNYRVGRKKRENILVTMLRKHERLRSSSKASSRTSASSA